MASTPATAAALARHARDANPNDEDDPPRGLLRNRSTQRITRVDLEDVKIRLRMVKPIAGNLIVRAFDNKFGAALEQLK
jgi:hypothetical protein